MIKKNTDVMNVFISSGCNCGCGTFDAKYAKIFYRKIKDVMVK